MKSNAKNEGNMLNLAITFITPSSKPQQLAIETLMHYQIPILPLPENLVISEVLTDDEMPKVYMKNIEPKLPKKHEAGPAFHAKSAKNSRVNVKVKRKDTMMKKYGKPIKRAPKK